LIIFRNFLIKRYPLLSGQRIWNWGRYAENFYEISTFWHITMSNIILIKNNQLCKDIKKVAYRAGVWYHLQWVYPKNFR